MKYEKKFENALFVAGFLIVGSIGLNYLGIGVLAFLFLDYSFIAYSVISPLLGYGWSGEVFEYFLILFGVIFATLGGLLIYIREFF